MFYLSFKYEIDSEDLIYLDESCEINIEKRLKKIGAKKIKERNMRRYVYDLKIDRDKKCGKWIRLRDNGEKITLTVKDICHKGIDDL